MIKKLKIKFIALAMISLTLLLMAIVSGMNIINYNKVVGDADERIEVIQTNNENFISNPLEGLFGRNGRRMSQDEAEELRFFTVLANSSGNVLDINTDRISIVDKSSAIEIANKALSTGKDSGFVDELRYGIIGEGTYIKMVFLDCGRVLDSYRDFLRASILMSLAGLLAVFFVILYFAGRIVKPVAESYEKQKRFITDAGHEIKTPLAIIKANIDLMNMEFEAAEGREIGSESASEIKSDLAEISNQTERLSNLTNDLVYLSRMEEGSSSPVMSDVPLSDILAESAASFAALANEKGVNIRADISTPVFARGNAGDAEKLVSIILDNAVKYAAEGSEIMINLRKDGKNAELEIRNEVSETLNPENLSHVFDRFYRTDSSRNSETGGHGIGLSMAKAIVSACGGSISVRTEDGGDFIIKVTLLLS